MQVRFLGWEDPLEEATHFSILARRIPVDREAWQATVHRVQRVRHDSSNLACIHAHIRNQPTLFLFCLLFKLPRNSGVPAFKTYPERTSLAVQGLRLCASNAGAMDSICGRGTKIPHALLCGGGGKKTKFIQSQRTSRHLHWYHRDPNGHHFCHEY